MRRSLYASRPDESGGLDKTADTLVAIVGATSLLVAVVETDPRSAETGATNEGLNHVSIRLAVRTGEVATLPEAFIFRHCGRFGLVVDLEVGGVA
eukprot:COSAG06_NODE_29918_length_548_cov_1.006682_1_plen_94_part_10